MPDRIEAGTFLCAGAITGGKIELKEVIPEHITPVIYKLQETGCSLEVNNRNIILQAPKKLKSIDIKTMPYPGFPTDLQSIFGAVLTTCKGTSTIVENIFENRYKYLSELQRMGAKITIEGKMAVIKGIRKLSGGNVSSADLRGGAALVLAGLSARGITIVENIDYIQRGYEKFEEKLQKLGAKIYIRNNK